MINDSQFDFYGNRLATASSSGQVKVFRMNEDQVDPNSISMLVDFDVSQSSA